MSYTDHPEPPETAEISTQSRRAYAAVQILKHILSPSFHMHHTP